MEEHVAAIVILVVLVLVGLAFYSHAKQEAWLTRKQVQPSTTRRRRGNSSSELFDLFLLLPWYVYALAASALWTWAVNSLIDMEALTAAACLFTAMTVGIPFVVVRSIVIRLKEARA